MLLKLKFLKIFFIIIILIIAVLAIYAIVCIGLIILTTIQTSDDKGVSGTITGSSTNNFFDQNKGRTREGKLKKWTIILGILLYAFGEVIKLLFDIKVLSKEKNKK